MTGFTFAAPGPLPWALAAGPPAPPGEGEAHLWRISTAIPQDQLAAVASPLDAPERQRAARFHFLKDRRAFIASHAALRHLLAAYLNRPAPSLAFLADRHGKPHLREPGDGGLAFNLSHSGTLALIAVASDRAVGVDVEAEREPSPHEELAARIFSAAELAAWRCLAAADRKRAFFAAWSLKEAAVKALGQGLTYPVRDLPVLAATGGWLRPRRAAAAAGRQWSLVAFAAAAGYAGAVAVPGPPPHLVPLSWRWPWEGTAARSGEPD